MIPMFMYTQKNYTHTLLKIHCQEAHRTPQKGHPKTSEYYLGPNENLFFLNLSKLRFGRNFWVQASSLT